MIDPSTERRRQWRIEANGLRVVDLRRPVAREELEADLSRLTGPRRAAQELTARVRALGADGMIVPSAAHPGHWNLVVFPSAFAKLRVSGSTRVRPKPPA